NFPRKNVRHANRDAQSGAIMTYLAAKSGRVSLKEAAAYFGYQANYFSRLCRKLFAMDFVHLRRNIRINLAREQLRLTNKTLEEIASELGYQDLSSFSKAFSEASGLTPGRFRKKYGLTEQPPGQN
ncbi:helix-turn-helix domain-containing protein, partial [Lactobacillus nasalidis]